MRLDSGTGVPKWFHRTEAQDADSGTYPLQSPTVGATGMVYVGWGFWYYFDWGTTVQAAHLCAFSGRWGLSSGAADLRGLRWVPAWSRIRHWQPMGP